MCIIDKLMSVNAFRMDWFPHIWFWDGLGQPKCIINIYYIYIFYTINNMISCLSFIILRIKISSHKFLNSLKYPYILVK